MYNVVFNDRYPLRRVGILRGWLIIYISVFRIPSRIVRLLLNRAASMRCFFSVSNPPEPVRIFMSFYQRISEILPIISERAARLLRQSRPLFDVLPCRRRAVAINNNSDFVTNASQFRLFAHLYFEVRTGIRCGFHFFF